jgi:hypothetical protein
MSTKKLLWKHKQNFTFGRLPDHNCQRSTDCALLVHRLLQSSTVAWKPIYLKDIVVYLLQNKCNRKMNFSLEKKSGHFSMECF